MTNFGFPVHTEVLRQKSQTPALTRRSPIKYTTNQILSHHAPHTAPYLAPQAKDTSFTSHFFAMYQDSSLSSLDRRHFGAFLTDKRRFERFQRNLLL